VSVKVPPNHRKEAGGGGRTVVRLLGDSRRVGVEHNYPVIEGWTSAIGDLLSSCRWLTWTCACPQWPDVWRTPASVASHRIHTVPDLLPCTRFHSLSIRSGSFCGRHWVYCLITWFTLSQLLLVHPGRPATMISHTVSWLAHIVPVRLCQQHYPASYLCSSADDVFR